MNQKLLLGTAIAFGLAMGASNADACAISAWSSATGLTAADTGSPPSFIRYSQACGLRVDAANEFVQDNTPENDAQYRVRFYVYTGDVTGNTPIFRARGTGGTSLLTVTYNGGASNSFVVGLNGTASTFTMPNVTDNRWYSVELNWTAAASGGVTGKIRGAGATSALGAQNVDITGLTGVNNNADRVTDAQLGALAASGLTFTAPMYFDDFDSRRTTSPGRKARGDANGNGNVTATDAVVVLNEAANGTLAAGQPDCNENGSVTATDGVCVLNIAANGD